MRLIELLDLKNDYVFKRIFGHKGNEEITKQMLNAIIKTPISTISLNENPILEKDLLTDKIGIVDIHAKINNSAEINIEMQVVDKKNIEKRLLFYWSKLYIQSISEGDSYSKLHKTIAILLADFKLEQLNSVPKFCTKWQLREEEFSSVILTDVLELYIIEMPKVKNANIDKLKQIKHWINFINNPKELELKDMDEATAKAIKQAKKELEKISADEHERYLSEMRQKYIRDQKAIEELGYDRGFEAGQANGIEKGKKERNKRRKTKNSKRNVKAKFSHRRYTCSYWTFKRRIR